MFTEAPVSVSVTTTHYYKSEMEVYQLANIKSAKKRILVNRTKAARLSLQSAKQPLKVFITKITVQERFPVCLKLSTALANSGNIYF